MLTRQKILFYKYAFIPWFFSSTCTLVFTIFVCFVFADEVDILGYGSSEEDQGSNSSNSSSLSYTDAASKLHINDDEL